METGPYHGGNANGKKKPCLRDQGTWWQKGQTAINASTRQHRTYLFGGEGVVVCLPRYAAEIETVPVAQAEAGTPGRAANVPMKPWVQMLHNKLQHLSPQGFPCDGSIATTNRHKRRARENVDVRNVTPREGCAVDRDTTDRYDTSRNPSGTLNWSRYELL